MKMYFKQEKKKTEHEWQLILATVKKREASHFVKSYY